MLCSFSVCVADWACLRLWSVGDGIEILDVKRKNLKPALLTDTGFIDTGWWFRFTLRITSPPP